MSRVLVTGSTTGLGLDAARALRREGHDVVVHARSQEKADALDEGGAGQGWAGVVVGDLASPDDVRSLVTQLDDLSDLDAVIHNAGVMSGPDVVQVNVLAPYVVTASTRRPARLVYLSSGMHRSGSTDLSRLTSGSGSYSDTKLWLTTLSAALADHWPGTTTQSVDPGWVPTRMGGSSAPDDLEEGHRTQVWLATTDEPVDPTSGGYWRHHQPQSPRDEVADDAFQAELLESLADVTGVALD